MKSVKTLLVVLPACIMLNACGVRPDPGSVSKSNAAPAVTSSADQTTPVAKAPTQSQTPTTETSNIATLQAKQSELEAQKSSLLNQQQDIQNQGAAFAQPADFAGAAFGDFMADAQALPLAVDQAKIDAIVQAAMDMDFDALQKAIDDLLADVQDAIADLQAQIDDLAAQIAVAQG